MGKRISAPSEPNHGHRKSSERASRYIPQDTTSTAYSHLIMILDFCPLFCSTVAEKFVLGHPGVEACENCSPKKIVFISFFPCFMCGSHPHTNCICATSPRREKIARVEKCWKFSLSSLDYYFRLRFSLQQTLGFASSDCYIVVLPNFMFIYNLIVGSFQRCFSSCLAFSSCRRGERRIEMQNDNWKD